MSFYTEYSSNIKKTYIELQNYSYFHGPSDISHTDARFIGRKSLIKKLQAILTNSETRSGAYLITGYRGMGKSSFVGKALEEISSCAGHANTLQAFLRYFLLVLLTHFLCGLFENRPPVLYLFGVAIASFGALIYFFFRNYRIHKPGAFYPVGLRQFGLSLFRLTNNHKPFHYFPHVLRDIFWVSSVYLAAIPLRQTMGAFIESFGVLLVLLFFLADALNWNAQKRQESKQENVIFEWAIRLWAYIQWRVQTISNFFKYSHRVHLKVNLGFEDLKEIDILRLIARNLETAYKSFVAFSRRNLITGVVQLLFVVISFYFIYNGTKISETTNSLKRSIGFYLAFPTQHPKYLNDSNNVCFDTISKRSYLELLQLGMKALDTDVSIVKGRLHIAERIPTLNTEWDVNKHLTTIFYYTAYLDVLIAELYYKSVIKLKSNSLVFSALINRLNIYKIDYFFVFYIALVYLALGMSRRTTKFGIVTHSYILRRLQFLNEQINTKIAMEQGGEFRGGSGPAFLSLFRRKTREYPIADVREIEKSLIEILDEMDHIPRYLKRPEVILVFDELDKIEPHKNLTILQREEQEAEDAPPADPYFSVESKRSRHNKILKLLSNLKHFLTTAKAKFIFVAGRDLYDASLADVSDRNNFLGSIFNEVIYVDSFLKDPSDRRTSDITSMIETYVCNFLLPPEYSMEELTLQTYNRYLDTHFFHNTVDVGLGAEDTKLAHLNRLKRAKIIFSLQNFITYLTYRSNGAPKKITAFFEEFITTLPERPPQKDEPLTDHFLIAGHNSKSLYLCFNYFNEFTFGMTSFLINPFFFYIHRSIKEFGDKLLVSSSFLIDHLYKFHNVGFSYRNLELIPEIVDFNKAPQLRELISRIITFLSYTHIQIIDTGIYTFKFYHKISEAISVLSKINERESAAFNFTLDESLMIKRHYKGELKQLETTYRPYFNTTENPEFIRSISLIHMIIGDLHFYDEEYDNAILEYLEAIQLFGEHAFSKFSIELMVVFIRNTLKLGITFEKKKVYESAYVNYGKLCVRVLQIGEVTDNDVGSHQVNSWLDSNRLGSNESRYVPFRQSILDVMRLMYQPFLSRFQILEKFSQQGIQLSDLTVLQNEVEALYLRRRSNRQETAFVRAEIDERIGDILFFKNGELDVNGEQSPYCKNDHSLCFGNPSVTVKGMLQEYKIPCSACKKYLDTLAQITNNQMRGDIIGKEKRALIIEALSYLDDPTYKHEYVYPLLANTFSDLGDTFLSCASSASEIRPDFLDGLLYIIGESRTYKEKSNAYASEIGTNSELSKIEEVLVYYYLSSVYYRQISDNRESALQLLKILYVLDRYLRLGNNQSNRTGLVAMRMAKIEDVIARRIIRRYYRVYENTHRIEIEQYKKIFDDPNFDSIIMNNFSLSWEIKEVVVLIQRMKLRTSYFTYREILKLRLGGTITPFSVVNNLYNRIIELFYQSNINYQLYRDLSDETAESWREWFPEYVSTEDIKIFLITDSIFCFYKILRSCFLYGTGYVINHSLIASAHDKLAFWCYEYNYCMRTFSTGKSNDLTSKMTRLIEADNLQTISEEYHKERALKHYRFALESHKEGKAYKKMIENMIYLNDDFNDNFIHFCAALERYTINSGSLNRKIEKIQQFNNSFTDSLIELFGEDDYLVNFYDKVSDYEFN